MKGFICPLFFIFSLSLNAQNFYLKFNSGASNYISHNRLSLGSGYNLGIGGGYFINKHFAVETTINYFRSCFTWYTEDPYPGGTITKMQYKPEGRTLTLNPSVLITTAKEKFNFYYRVGPVIGIGREIYNYIWSGNSIATSTSTFKASGGFVYGLNQTTGIKLKISNHFFLFAEGTFSLIDHRATLWSYRIFDPNFYPSDDTRSEKEIINNLYSNFGVNAGLIFSLSK